MSWVTVIWSMVASTCLTVAAIYFFVWFKDRSAKAHLLFSLTAASTAALAFCELWIMRARTPADLVAGLRWGQLAVFFLFVSITWFIRIYLGAGRLWLAWTITGVRSFYLLLTFAAGINVHYRAVTSLRQIQFLGEPVTVLSGVPNPLTLFGQFGVVLMLVFVVDASLTAWRRGDRRRARMAGGSVVFFILAGLSTFSIVFWGNVQAPIVVSQCYLGLIAVMGYELSRDMLRASQLVRELKVSETELRESEARMSLAVDVADFGIWIRDLARDDIWASAKWRQLFGFGLSEPLDFPAILNRVHPDDRDGLQRDQALAMTRGSGGTYQTECRVMLPDGSTRWIASRGRVEVDAANRPVLIRGASRDVTERRRAELETQRLHQEIAHAGRVSIVGQLASGLAHEINQPLASILRNAEAAELFLQDPSPDLDEIRAILTDIRKDDERAGHVIDRVRGLLKRQTLQTKRLNVASLVGDVAALVRVDAATRQVKLDVGVPDVLPSVLGDRVQLQQVLLNLILNGMDALDGARPEDRRVSVTARLESPAIVEIAVADGGPGIPADRLPKIFDPFFTTKANGMGMGLAISRSIVEAHRGRLWAENRSGGGATFRFTLPIAEDAAAT